GITPEDLAIEIGKKESLVLPDRTPQRDAKEIVNCFRRLQDSRTTLKIGECGKMRVILMQPRRRSVDVIRSTACGDIYDATLALAIFRVVLVSDDLVLGHHVHVVEWKGWSCKPGVVVVLAIDQKAVRPPALPIHRQGCSVRCRGGLSRRDPGSQERQPV